MFGTYARQVLHSQGRSVYDKPTEGKPMPIIDTPGTYTARGGRTVIIDKIDDPAKATFNCKGHWIKPDSLGRKRRHFSIWKQDGAYVAGGAHSLDVVAKEIP